MRIGLFGGAFDPPHLGHMMAVYAVLATERVDQVWMLPAWQHPFGKVMAPFEDRVRLCQLAAAPFAGVVEVSRVEAEVGGEGRTVDTLSRLVAIHPDHEWALIIGADIVPELGKWKEWPKVEQMARVIVVGRQGYPAPHGGPLLPDISSTEVRARLARGEDCSRLVPSAVLEQILARRLFGVQRGQ